MADEIPVTNEPKPVSNNERTWGTIVHLSALAGIIFPVLTIIAPLFIWLVKRKEMPFIDDQGKEAVNFQLTMLIGFIICIPLAFILIGVVLAFVLGIVDLIFIILAGVSANRGEHYRYPFNWRIIK